MIFLATLTALLITAGEQNGADGGDPASLHDRVRRERVDVAWAREAEPALEGVYAPLRGIGPVAVRCGSTLCEVSGEIAPGEESAATAQLQGAEVGRAVRALGFDGVLAFRVSVPSARGGRASFASYWARGSAGAAFRR